ncbi:hypothetical protein ALC62_07103 [Cyphomyrmex costatus]|uniref:Uncharacterized protein n=1 Tax=Cyphomyrmex costatus TaxID=456900 RepID=A0A195CN27_9HYME|nr:hypothetical protein ALC62_07103 [Cyphomyrmex costatus]
MSRRGPVLETRREDFANDKGSLDKEASWSRTRKAFLVRVVRKSTSRVRREITELANERTGDSTANTWTDRESFLRERRPLRPSRRFFTAGFMEDGLLLSAVYLRLTWLIQQRETLFRKKEKERRRLWYIDYGNRACSCFFKSRKIPRIYVDSADHEAKPIRETVEYRRRGLTRYHELLWTQRCLLNIQRDFLKHNANVKKGFINSLTFSLEFFRFSWNFTQQFVLANTNCMIFSARPILSRTLPSSLSFVSSCLKHSVATPDPVLSNGLQLVKANVQAMVNGAKAFLLNFKCCRTHESIRHANSYDHCDEKRLVMRNNAKERLMAAGYARGHKRQGSPTSYVTLNTSTGQGGASEITSGSLESLTSRLLNIPIYEVFVSFPLAITYPCLFLGRKKRFASCSNES